ncbi:MAG: hypothetical protein ACLTXI_11945, partial [Collinsella sp.]
MAIRREHCPDSVWRSTWWAMASPRSIAARCSAWGPLWPDVRFMMTFTYLGREGAKPRVLESGARVHVMAGTAEVVGRIMFMEGEAPMAVGETRIVQVRLENSLPLRAGDHAVVLSYSPVMLIGGGRVLLSRCRRSRELSEGERSLYAALESGDIAGGVGAWLALQTLPFTAADVTAALDLVAGEAEAA